MTFGLVDVGYSLPFGQAVKLIFFAPCHYACQGKTYFGFSSGSISGPPQLPASGNSALLGGVVKGANSFFSNIKDMSNKVMQSVAGYVQHFCGCS